MLTYYWGGVQCSHIFMLRLYVQYKGREKKMKNMTIKKLLASILVGAMLVPMGAITVLAEDAVNGIATSAIDLVNEIEQGGSIKLDQDISADISVGEGKEVVLDLNGHTLTNESDHTIINNGTLTINDSVAETNRNNMGAVDNISHAKAAILNKGIMTVNGGKYTRSQENGINATNNGGNSYYNIENQGTMTLAKMTEVIQDGGYSSMIHNGWYDVADNTSDKIATLIIESGIYNGGLNTIKNDEFGELVINGGTFSNQQQASLLNWNRTTINGGWFLKGDNQAAPAILNGSYAGSSIGKLIINDITIFNETAIELMSSSTEVATIELKGGKFYSSSIYDNNNNNDEQYNEVRITGGIYYGVRPDTYVDSEHLVIAEVVNGEEQYTVIHKKDKLLREAKIKKTEEIEEFTKVYIEEDYTATNIEILMTYKYNALEEVMELKTVEEVEAYSIDLLKKSMDSVMTISGQAKLELEAAKKVKIAEVDKILKSYDHCHVTQKEAITKLYKVEVANINALTTVESVQDYNLATFKAASDKIAETEVDEKTEEEVVKDAVFSVLDDVKDIDATKELTTSEKVTINNATASFTESVKDLKDKVRVDDDAMKTVIDMEKLFVAANKEKIVVELIAPVVDNAVEAKDKLADKPVQVEGLAVALFGGTVPAEKTEVGIKIKQSESKGDTLVLNIKPAINGEAVSVNDKLQTPVSFKIYLNEGFWGTHARVLHKFEAGGSETLELPVQEDTEGTFIVMTVTQFSDFEVTPVNKINKDDTVTENKEDVKAETVVQTGDMTNYMIFTVLMILSGIAIVGVSMKKRVK